MIIDDLLDMIAEPTNKALKHIEAKMARSECLCCTNPQLKRGLCYQCYYAWRTERSALPSKAARLKYDANLIRKGFLLAAQAVRRFGKKAKSVFTREAQKAS